MTIRSRWPLAAVLALAPSLSLHAQQPASHLVVADRDAEGVSMTRAGAVFGIDLADGPGTAPLIEASALSTGARFEFLSAVAIDPISLKAYLTDVGASNGPGAVHSVDGDTAASVMRRDPNLVEPWDLAFLPDGRMVVVDSESDPSSLGADAVGGAGHGGVFWVDPQTGVATLLADGRNHPDYVGAPAGSSIFQDPVSVTYDRTRNLLYVADNSANPLNLRDGSNQPILGAVFSVDLVTGRVTLVAQNSAFLNVIRVAARPDGKILVVDALENDFDPTLPDSIVFLVDPANTDPRNNVTEYSQDGRFGFVEDVGVDGTGQVFVADAGVWNGTRFLIDPRIWKIDEGNTDIDSNAEVVNESGSLVWPVGVEPVAAFDVRVSTPSAVPLSQPAVCGPIVVRLEGSGLYPQLRVSLGSGVTIVDVRYPAGDTSGAALEVELAPTVPGTYDVTVSHPFGATELLAGGLSVVDVPPIVPADPCSRYGDANCDTTVDGLDLAILGRHYATSVCTPAAFYNDADFDNDDFIDGDDLAILATFFGQQF